MKGFFNRVLRINLSDQSWKPEEIDDQVYRTYLGAKGLGTYLLFVNNPAGTDPLGPENHLIFAVGCSADTKVHGSSRYGIFTKSPLTDIYSESYSGGRVAEAISRTGYDAIMLEGISTRPVYLEISDKGVRFHEATHLWGKDTYTTEDQVLNEVGQKGAQAVVIGPAGENLVRFSVVENNYWRSAGRSGPGTVMGSKKVKAIVFYGNRKRDVARPEILEEHWERMIEKGKDDQGVKIYRKLGTPMMVAILNKVGSFPSRYWSEGNPKHWEKLTADYLLENFKVKATACPKCFMACGKLTEVLKGRHKGLKIEGPEYETIYSFGGLCMIDSLEEIAYLNDICDRMGMDTITAGNLCAFAIEAALRGKIDFPIDYGDVDAVAKLLWMIARKEGIGAVLAEGIRFASHEWGLEDIAIHVKGMEPAGYDPRVLKGMGLAYAVSDRGACHLRATFYKPELAGIIDPDKIEGKAELFVKYEDRLTIFDTFVLCRFFRDLILWEDIQVLLEGITGENFTIGELGKVAANITDLTRKFNLREGITAEDDCLPERFYKERLPESGKSIEKKDLEKMRGEYYRLRGWDAKGIPG
nr:aldehyde:ferredoxin oxidoreductase [Desulfobacterales bacterium]